MQETKRFKTQHPASGGRAGIVRCVGLGSEGLLEALHAGKGTGKGKKNAVGLRGG